MGHLPLDHPTQLCLDHHFGPISGGYVILALGLYLAYWVRTKEGGSASLWWYLIIIVTSILGLASKGVGSTYVPGFDGHPRLDCSGLPCLVGGCTAYPSS